MQSLYWQQPGYQGQRGSNKATALWPGAGKRRRSLEKRVPALQTCARSTTSAFLECVLSQLSTEQLASGGKALAPVKAVLQAAAARLSLPNVAHLVCQQARCPPYAALQPLQTCLVQRRSPSPLCTFPFPPRQAMPSGTQLSGRCLKWASVLSCAACQQPVGPSPGHSLVRRPGRPGARAGGLRTRRRGGTRVSRRAAGSAGAPAALQRHAGTLLPYLHPFSVWCP